MPEPTLKNTAKLKTLKNLLFFFFENDLFLLTVSKETTEVLFSNVYEHSNFELRKKQNQNSQQHLAKRKWVEVISFFFFFSSDSLRSHQLVPTRDTDCGTPMMARSLFDITSSCTPQQFFALVSCLAVNLAKLSRLKNRNVIFFFQV